MFLETADQLFADRIKKIHVQSYYGKEPQNILISHECFAFIFIYSGKATIEYEDKRYTIYSPSVLCCSHRDEIPEFFIHKDTTVHVMYFDTTFLTKGMCMDLVFRADFTDFIDRHYFYQLRPFTEKDICKKCFTLTNTMAKHTSQLLLRIRHQLKNQPDYYWPCRARSGLMELLTIVERMLYDYGASEGALLGKVDNQKEEFRKISEYVISNLERNIGLDELCKMFYTSMQTIERQFKKHFNMSYKQYVRQQRYEIAKQNLRFTKLSIKEIAGIVGYSGVQSFTRFFRDMSGTTPVQFRQEQIYARRADPKLQSRE